MPHMTLPSGTAILLGVFHEDAEVRVKGEPKQTSQTRVRVSLVTKTTETGEKITDQRGREYAKRLYETGESCETKAVCSPSDAFNRETGRYIAARRLMKMDLIRQKMTKDDRRALMKRICPELFTSRRDIEHAIYLRLKKKFEPAPADDTKVA